jgi:hypothetical protein
MPPHGYTQALRTFFATTYAGDRSSVAAIWRGLGSSALDAFLAEVNAYRFDQAPTEGRYYSAHFAEWLESPDGELATANGRADLRALDKLRAMDRADPATERLHADAVAALVAEWQAVAALHAMASAEAEAEVSTTHAPWAYLDDPHVPPDASDAPADDGNDLPPAA